MPELCQRCVHRRAADKTLAQQLRISTPSAAGQATLSRLRNEYATAIAIEEKIHSRTGGATLDRRPMVYEWCAAQSNPAEFRFWFCDWLEKSSCKLFKPEDAAADAGPVADGADTAKIARAGTAASAATASPTTSAEWSLPLGQAFDLHPVSRASDGKLGPGSFIVDYELDDSDEKPAIRGTGLEQTYLIFGGPGAGKTYYFKYLLQSLLAHPKRPGCLLLDPKGALTPWLAGTLKKLGRAGDLTVLAAGTNENAFNVLGDDLAPNELGRLLSEVVLAGASGVDEGWQVLIADLLESAAIVIHAESGIVTAAEILGAILYRKGYTYPDGTRKKEYPIVIRAGKLAKNTTDVDVRIACDRVEDFFKSTEDRQRRFVRQIIERSLGELMTRDWKYLSSPEKKSVYSGIINDNRIVTVAVGQSSPAFQRSMSTLVKAIFQQAALADLTRRTSGQVTGERPFFILACDEYAQAITEGETGLVSDSRFFSLSREAGCMSLLALQSMATGRSRFPASMHDRWAGILGNVTVKLFMRVNDVETAEFGSELAGSVHSFVPVLSQQRSAQGLSATEAVTMLEHKRVPPWYLTNRMPRGFALVHGTLDGESVPTSLFVRAPSKY